MRLDEVELRHRTRDERLLCLMRYTGIGNNTNTHTLPLPKFNKGHFRGFATYCLGAIELTTVNSFNIFYLSFVVAEGCQDDETFYMLRK